MRNFTLFVLLILSIFPVSAAAQEPPSLEVERGHQVLTHVRASPQALDSERADEVPSLEEPRSPRTVRTLAIIGVSVFAAVILSVLAYSAFGGSSRDSPSSSDDGRELIGAVIVLGSL